jgi:hypothetical protein
MKRLNLEPFFIAPQSIYLFIILYLNPRNMKKTLLSISLLGCALITNSQTPKYEWAKNMGGSLNTIGNSIAVDNLGNIYTAGSFDGVADFDPSNLSTANLTSAGKEDIFITKFNNKGEFIWAKQIGSTGADLVHHLKLDGAGNPYITGSFEGTVDFDPNAAVNTISAIGSADIFVAKLDINGNFVWAKNFGGPQEDKGIALDIQGTSIVCTGYYRDTINFDNTLTTAKHSSKGSADVYIAKFDLLGNYLWSKAIGGSSDEEGKSVSIDKSGNVLVTGFFNGSVDFDPSSSDYYRAADAARDIYILKLDKNGLFKYVKVVGGKGFDGGQTILTDAVNNIYTVGYFSNNVDFDPGVGDAYISSGTASSIFIQKLDSNGLFQWAKNFNASITAYSQSAALDPLGNIYVIGYFNTLINFGTGSGLASLTSTGLDDIFVVKMLPSGKYASANKISGVKYENGFSLTMNSASEMFATGQFSGTTDFDPSVNIANLAASTGGISNAFVVKWSNFPTTNIHQEIVTDRKLLNIFPNPNQGTFNINLGEAYNEASVEIKNTLGQTLYTLNNLKAENNIRLEGLSTGLYFVTLLLEGRPISSKTISVL